uniref:uncharacterized protein isoform X2 n=1 Tax=Myxine glutinosa TaxID=7769 RepID=UPI00358ECBD3
MEKTFVDWFYTADRQESPLAFWQDPSLWGFFWFVLLLPKILDFLVIRLWQKHQNLTSSTTVYYHKSAVLCMLLLSLTSIWIFFEKLFLPPPEQEVTFPDWMNSIFSALTEKTFVDWFYTADRQESPLAFWQDPSLWCFFWFVLLLPKILDFLVIRLWQKHQNLTSSTTVYYHKSTVLCMLLLSLTSIWIFFEKLFLPPQEQEVIFHDWIYNSISPHKFCFVIAVAFIALKLHFD